MDATDASTAFNPAAMTASEKGHALHLLLASTQNFDEAKAVALVEAGANIEFVNEQNETPLIAAVMHRHESFALLLIEKNARVDARDKFGFTALILASSLGLEKTVDALVAKKADLAIRDEVGRQDAFHMAASQGQEGILKRLVRLGVALETPDGDGYTPRAAALKGGHTGAAKIIDDAIFERDRPLREEQQRKAYAIAHIGDPFRDGIAHDEIAPPRAQFRKLKL